MKIQTTAQVQHFSVDNRTIEGAESRAIDLEFSALDTGGGFKDPIIDFSLVLPDSVDNLPADGRDHEMNFTLSAPNGQAEPVSFLHEGPLQETGYQAIEINGRLKEQQLRRELIDFVFTLLR